MKRNWTLQKTNLYVFHIFLITHLPQSRNNSISGSFSNVSPAASMKILAECYFSILVLCNSSSSRKKITTLPPSHTHTHIHHILFGISKICWNPKWIKVEASVGKWNQIAFLLCFVCYYFIYLWEKFTFFLLMHSFSSCLGRKLLLWPKAEMLCCLLGLQKASETAWGLHEIRPRELPLPQG